MARTPSAPPEDVVEFVERRDAGLRLAAHALTGNVRLAESLVQDLLAATAARWRRLTRSEDSTGRAGGGGSASTGCSGTPRGANTATRITAARPAAT